MKYSFLWNNENPCDSCPVRRSQDWGGQFWRWEMCRKRREGFNFHVIMQLICGVYRLPYFGLCI